jgi:flagellar biosynthesis/type III secretory pathway ATPase
MSAIPSVHPEGQNNARPAVAAVARAGHSARACPATTAQAAENVTEFFLDNGMQVVVIEDHRSPAVVHMVWYRAGAADEPPGSRVSPISSNT